MVMLLLSHFETARKGSSHENYRHYCRIQSISQWTCLSDSKNKRGNRQRLCHCRHERRFCAAGRTCHHRQIRTRQNGTLLRCGSCVRTPALLPALLQNILRAGVTLFTRMGCIDYLCFGAENADLSQLNKIAGILVDEPRSYQDALNIYLKEGKIFLPPGFWH